MKKSIIRKVIALVISLLLTIIVIMTISNILLNAKNKDAKILQNQLQHISLIELLNNQLSDLSTVSYKMSRLDDKRLFKQQKQSIHDHLTLIHKLTKILSEGGSFEYELKVNFLEKNVFLEKIEYHPNSKEQLTELIESQPRIENLEELCHQLIEKTKLYYQDNTNTTLYNESISLYKQQESLIYRLKETTNRAFITANDKRNSLKVAMDDRMRLFNIIRWLLISLLMLIVAISLRLILQQISKIVDQHEEATIKLEESNKTIQKILDSLPVGIAVADRKQRIKHINNTALKWMEETSETNYLDQHCSKVFCLENEDTCPITSDKLIIHDIELDLIQTNGNKLSIMKSAIPIRLNDEDVILEAFMDISKQKEAEQALVDQKRFTDAVLNSALVGIVVIDAETHEILSINKKATEMIGDDESRIIGQVCNEYICPAEKGNCPITDHDVLVQNQHKKLLTANGESKHILKSVKKTEINGKRVYVESFVDISDRIKAENELRKLSRVVEESPASIVITNKNGNIEYVNPKFSENTGYKVEEVIGKNPRIINARNEENTVDYEVMWKTILDGNIWRGEFCNKRKDGSIFWEQASISPFRDQEGNITHFIAIKDDITDRKEFEKKLKLEKTRANAANEAKGFFLAKMSHEIRTPMNGIIGMTDILLESVEDKDVSEKLKIISVSAENLLTIINEILDFSKIEAGQVELESIPINIQDLVNDIKNLLIIKAKEKNLFLKTEISDQLPEFILGDPTRLKQIIINLVNNAIKFTEQGGITVLLEKKSKSYNEHQFIMKVSIIDTGIGISKEGKSKLFKAFSQTSSSTTRTHGGTGLGLLISKDLAKLMGGDIGIDSTPDEGSTFWVNIPSSEAKKEEMSTQEKEQLRETKNLHILVAEDNVINQKIALLNLEKLGHKVQFANNGMEAVELYKKEKFHLILMDIQMPQMGGLEATGIIRDYEKQNHILNKIPIVALTANALKTDKDKYIAAGMNDYLSKPFKQKELVDVLSRLHI